MMAMIVHNKNHNGLHNKDDDGYINKNYDGSQLLLLLILILLLVLFKTDHLRDNYTAKIRTMEVT